MKQLKIAVATLLLTTLAACGGNGVNGISDDSNNIPNERPSGKIAGVAYDGLILDGDVTIYAFDGKKGAVLATSKTDLQGEYSVSLQAISQPILIEITGGRYIEEASGANIPLTPNQILRAVEMYASGIPVDLNITYWTTLAAGLAEYQVSVGTPVAQAITDANAAFTDILGLDIIKTRPVDITNISNASAFVTPSIEYGFFEAALSKWTAYASQVNKREPHIEFSSIAFAQLAYDDIKHDGLLNGMGTVGKVTFGVISLSPAIYRHALAAYLLKMAQDPRNNSGIKADKLLATAQRLNDSILAVFAGVPVTKIDGDGPLFTDVTPIDKTAVHGTFSSTAAIIDILGLTTVDFLIDGTLVGSAADVNNPSLDINSKNYVDGAHTLVIKASNLAGSTMSKTINITVNNTQTTVSNIVPVANSHNRGGMTASADVTDPIGLQSVQFYVDSTSVGLAPQPTKPSVSIDTTNFADGTHTLKVKATNTVGNSVTGEVMFITDNTAPVISAYTPADKTLVSGKIDATVTAIDNNLAGVEYLLDGNSLGNATDKTAAKKTINTAAYPDGAHTLALRAFDYAGGSTTKTVVLTIDNTAPVISNAYPEAGTIVRGVFDVGAVVKDLSLARVQFDLDGAYYNIAGGLNVIETFVDSARLTDGPHTITIIATDRSGLQTQTNVYFIVDNTPPTVIYTPSINTIRGYGAPVDAAALCEFSGSVSDSTSGLRSVMVGATSIPTTNGQWAFTTRPVTSGNVLVVATDIVGNARTTSIAFEVGKFVIPNTNGLVEVTCQIK